MKKMTMTDIIKVFSTELMGRFVDGDGKLSPQERILLKDVENLIDEILSMDTNSRLYEQYKETVAKLEKKGA